MNGLRYDRILAGTALALILAIPVGGLAQNPNKIPPAPTAASPAEPMATQAPAPTAASPAEEASSPTPLANPAVTAEQPAAPDPMASLDPADTGTDLGDRVALYNQAQTILIQDAPVAPLFVRGRLVAGVFDASPASRAGLKPGDLILTGTPAVWAWASTRPSSWRRATWSGSRSKGWG